MSWAVRGLVVGGVGGGVTERAYCVAATRVRSESLKTTEDLLRQLLPIVPNDDDFANAFARAPVSRPGVARYVMVALERHARGIANPELVDEAFDDGFRLQYVIPTTADADDWPGIEDDDLKSLVTRLGNLVILSDQDASLTGATTFDERRKVFEDSTVELTRGVVAWDEWDAHAIGERQDQLAERANEVWPREPRRG